MPIDYFSFGLKPDFNFETLVIGKHNQFAAAACQEVAKNPGTAYNPLFVYGPPGVGKTHLVQAVAQQLLVQNENARVRYVPAERLMSDIIQAIAQDNVIATRNHYGSLDLLIVDDLQYLTQSVSTQEELLHILNSMNQANHQIILAGDRPASKIMGISDTLRSRLEGGLTTDVQVPDVETRVEILNRKQQRQNLNIPEELLFYVAQRLRNNVREIEGFLKRMHAYVHLSHQSITAQLVHSVVREILPEGAADLPSEPLLKEAPPVVNPAPVPPPPPKPAAAPPPSPPVAPPQPPPVAQPVQPPAPPPAPPPEPAPPPVVPKKEEAPVPQPAETKQEIGSAPDNKSPNEPPAEVTQADILAVDPQPTSPPGPTELDPIQAFEDEEMDEDPSLQLKEIQAVFFFPEGKEESLESVTQKFQDVIKKHKLKFRLKRVHSHPYKFKEKVNYTGFVDVCKENKVPVAVVVGPPPEGGRTMQDFQDLLSVTLDVQGISLQLINWSEITKDYRYLNLALDIALVRTR